MSAFIFRLLLSFAALLPLGVINAPGDARAAPYPEIDAWLRRQPLILFVAKGPANACGPGCSEWIAAEGLFDSDAPQRLRDFLATLSRRDLPVFFNSNGGKLKAGTEVGSMLRDHRMTVGIGRTVPDGCRNAAATDDACRRVMQSQAEHKARLITAGARCASACVVAFAGGSVRQVARDAQLGIHSARVPKSAPVSVDEGHRILKRYLVQLGVDAGLIDAAAKISADDLRYLSRDEIARFGVETRNVYETAWLPYLEPDKRPAVLKSVTQPKGASGREYRTSSIQISCYGAGPSLWFAYRRELASDEIGLATAVRAAAGGAEFSVGGTSASGTSVDRRVMATGGEFLAKAIAAPAIVITETFTPAGNEPAWSREIKFSTNGLAKSVEDLQKSCPSSPAVAAPADDFRTCHAASGDLAMSACTRAIASGRYRGSDLAPLYNMRGANWRAKGELDRAFADLDEAIRLDPNGARAYNNRGLAWRDKRDLDRAIADYTDAIRLDAKYRTAYNNRGLAWRDKGDLDRAIADFNEAIGLDPKYSIAYYNRGLAWRDKDDLDRAIADYTEAIRLDPTFAVAYNNRGTVWRAKGELDRAIADYTEAIRLDPDPKNARAYNNRALAWHNKGDLDRAIADYTEVIRLDPKDARASYNRGLAWRAKGDLDHAIADYTEAIRLDPKFISAYNDRGLAWRDKGDLDRAIADFTEAMRLDPKYAWAYSNRGLAWRDKGDLDRAIADFNEAIGLDPKYSTAYYNRGLAWRDKGDLDRAVADYTEAIRLDPNYAIAYNNRGTVWRDKGDLDRAIADFDEAIRLAPDPKDARAYNNRGLAWRNKGDLDRAIADYTQAIRLDPKYAFAYYNRGFAWRDKDDLDRAIADYTEAVQLGPKNAAHYRGRGYAYFHKGDFTASAADLLRATDLADNAYGMLFRYLARGRLEQDGAAELGTSAARLKSRDWPYAVIDFYLGLRSLTEMRAAANRPKEKCEAEFYTGQWHLLRGSNAEARTALQVAADTCPKTYIEYSGAVAELKRLEATRRVND